jgi:hypothetical protein
LAKSTHLDEEHNFNVLENSPEPEPMRSHVCDQHHGILGKWAKSEHLLEKFTFNDIESGPEPETVPM